MSHGEVELRESLDVVVTVRVGEGSGNEVAIHVHRVEIGGHFCKLNELWWIEISELLSQLRKATNLCSS